ncbi:MAG TPA: hypothetical protein DDW68_07400 [Verrucomicrobiales bacterium]|nr:hypothetical protein [Verrucomicrobiales bacterium]HBE96982.1 hypothetical protein [Verrucomicrobiales bacterium]
MVLSDHVELVKKWWKIRKLVFRVSNPKLLGDIPMSNMGKIEMKIDDRSRQEAKNLTALIEFQRSVFLLNKKNKRLTTMREE